MSEWGNPARREAGYFRKEEPTRGTETSQYPEEQKSTEILLVAVSERGTGQTGGACSPGVVGRTPWDARREGEAAWNGPPQTVKAR